MTSTKRPSRTEDIAADLRAGLRNAEVARRHGVSRGRVHQVRKQFGIPHPPKAPKPPPARSARYWTDEQVTYLINHPGMSVAELAAQVGRPVSSVLQLRKRLIREGRLPRRPSRWDAPGSGHKSPFTPAELAVIDDPTLPAAEVAQRTGRTVVAIQARRRQRGIHDPQRWTEAEIEQVIALQDRPIAEVAAALGRTMPAIASVRRRLIRAGRITSRRRRSKRRE